jgi:hypothetical protein
MRVSPGARVYLTTVVSLAAVGLATSSRPRRGPPRHREKPPHTWCMRRNPRGRQDQQQRIMAYLTDDHTPDIEKGWVVLAMAGHAVIALLLTAAEAICGISMVVRVWRRRDAGVTRAIRTGVHRPTLAAVLAAHLLYAILRRAGVQKLDALGAEHAARQAARQAASGSAASP